MKISAWLRDNIGSHEICDADNLAKSFEKEVGLPATDWPTYSESETRQAINARGLGGELKPTKSRVVWGYTLAAHLARKHANNFSSHAMGRGTIYSHCVAALEAAGH